MKRFSEQIKQSATDEWYTPAEYVKWIVPFLKAKGFRRICAPWDTERSEFVKVLSAEGFDVTYSHIHSGTDFYEIEDFSKFDAVVSNPPFSQRTKILERLFEVGIPFAVILDFNGIFDNKTRWELFSKYDFTIVVPQGRMKFFNDEQETTAQPMFQSVYICRGISDKQIIFLERNKDNPISGQIGIGEVSKC